MTDGLIHYGPEASPDKRYRVMDTGGCAPDIFWAVLAADMSVQAELICPATGTAIRVDLSPEGVELVEPPGTVVTVLNLRAQVLQEMDNVADADVCSQQSFFASAEAAGSWLASHPGGRIYPVAAFFEWFRRNLAVVKGNAEQEVSSRGGWGRGVGASSDGKKTDADRCVMQARLAQGVKLFYNWHG
jgi:hypothetical protein